MPNGGTDNCGECRFGDEIAERRVRCRLRHIEVDRPYWTYCANNPVTNPDGIEVPIGPVYVVAGGHHYRRIVLLPSEDGHIPEKLEILERAARGGLDRRTRKLQAALIDDLARQNVVEAVEYLVDLALAKPAGLTPVGFAGPEAEIFDLSYTWETDAVRVEYIRLAALRALRKLEEAPEERGLVLATLRRRRAQADADRLRRINIAMAFVLDGMEPP